MKVRKADLSVFTASNRFIQFHFHCESLKSSKNQTTLNPNETRVCQDEDLNEDGDQEFSNKNTFSRLGVSLHVSVVFT